MMDALLSIRERRVWTFLFVGVAALLVITRFTSSDPDSALYASISAKLSEQPVAEWIAPQWWGLWPQAHQTGYFREHPSGLFWIPALLGRLGVPPEQGAYIFGVGCGLAALLLASRLVGRLASAADGRATLVLLQLMPVAFVFRLRDNHEYPMLVCLLLGLVGLDGVNKSWWWTIAVAVAFGGGLVVKGVFVIFVLMAAGLWVLIHPSAGASRAREITACALGIVAMATVAFIYDAAYLKVTGEAFWIAYWHRQLGPVASAVSSSEAWVFIRHVGFYLVRLLFHPAPWSLALAWFALTRPDTGPSAIRERRGLTFAVIFAALSVLLLSVASRFAERYAFSATYMIGAAGVVVSRRMWPAWARWLATVDAAIPALPAVVWFVLMILRLALGPYLPRIGA
jgi:4-amino-4-deoxy-L-arabinose transferase-like glycosyltransferase